MKETTLGKEKLGVNEKYATLAPDRFVAKSQDMIYHHLSVYFLNAKHLQPICFKLLKRLMPTSTPPKKIPQLLFKSREARQPISFSGSDLDQFESLFNATDLAAFRRRVLQDVRIQLMPCLGEFFVHLTTWQLLGLSGFLPCFFFPF